MAKAEPVQHGFIGRVEGVQDVQPPGNSAGRG